MSQPEGHAKYSPSGASRWMVCSGSIALSKGLPDTTNPSAEEGTAAHELASWALTDGAYYCEAYLGRITTNNIEVTRGMCRSIQVYVDAIRARVEEYILAGAVKVKAMIEHRVDFSRYVGVPGQFGTGDAVFFIEWPQNICEISIEDLKSGYRLVEAELNEQLMMYALGVLDEFELLGEIRNVRCVIHQPNRDTVSDWSCTVEELLEFADRVKAAAARCEEAERLLETLPATAINTWAAEYLSPGSKQCHYCKAKPTCPALLKEVTEARSTPEPRGKELGRLRDKVDMIRDWCNAIEEAVHDELTNGGEVPGWKIVDGTLGNRKWTSENEVESTLKAMRLKQEEMYDFSLISPTVAEKLLKKEKPRCWTKLQTLITRKPGRPSVVAESNKREAITLAPVTDVFTNLDEEDSLV